jgi:hypothetical protein
MDDRTLRLPSLPVRLALTVSLASLATYAATAARALYWGDSPELVAVARTLGVAHPPGYPLYTLLGALAVRLPAGDPFFRLSIMSAVFAAAAAGVVTALTWALVSSNGWGDTTGGGRLACGAASVLAGLLFAFSGALWSQATIPEVYSLAALLAFGSLLAVVARGGGRPAGDRRLALLGLLLGLALAHHLTAALLVPSVAVVLFSRPRGRPSARGLARALLFAAVGLSLYVYLPIRAAEDPPLLWARVDSFGALVRHISGAQYASRLFSAPAVEVFRRLGVLVVALPRDLSWTALVLSGVGFWALWSRSRVLLTALVLYAALVVVHAIGYGIPDPEAYYIPLQGILSIAAGIGLAALAATPRRLWAVAAITVALAGLVVQAGSQWRERDLRTRTDARVYLDRVLDTIEPGGIVIAQNDGTVFPLWYARFVEGLRSDVAIMNIRERAPHLARWYPGVRFPTEEELSTYLERVGVRGFDRPLTRTVPLSAYVPLFLALNLGPRPLYADAEIARKVCPDRVTPRGLIVEIAREPIPPSPASFASVEKARWDSYLAGLEGQPRTDRRTLTQYATMLGETGNLYLVRGETPSAVAALERATALAPWLPQPHNNLGIAYQSVGRFNDAIREFEKTLALRPGLAETHYNIYASSVGRRDLARAEAELAQAARLDRRNSRYALELAAFYRAAGEPREAAEAQGRLGRGRERR